MPLTSAFGIRIGRTPVTGQCQMQASGFNSARFGTAMGTGRARDTTLAGEIVAALRRGIPARVGLNTDGVKGVGTVWHYRPQASVAGALVDHVVKFDSVHDVTHGVYNLADRTSTDALRADVLWTLRHDHFRVVSFSDFYADRGFTMLHPHNIEYTAPVAARLRHVPISQLTCQLDSRHARNNDPFQMHY